jgi:hypothetical protein
MLIPVSADELEAGCPGVGLLIVTLGLSVPTHKLH